VNKNFSREATVLPPKILRDLPGHTYGSYLKTTETIQPEQRFDVTTGGNAAEWNILHGEMGRELANRSNQHPSWWMIKDLLY
jgi:hypothetical protein